MRIDLRLVRRFAGLAFGVWLTLSYAAAQATVIVDAAVSPSGGFFHYELTIQNTGPDDVLSVSIFDAPLSDSLIGPSLIAPVGFYASYDSGLGIVNFLADTTNFAAGLMISGFSFDSLSGPTTNFGQFESLTDSGSFFSGDVNLTIVEVPEPGTFAVVFLGLAVLGLMRRRLAVLGLAACGTILAESCRRFRSDCTSCHEHRPLFALAGSVGRVSPRR